MDITEGKGSKAKTLNFVYAQKTVEPPVWLWWGLGAWAWNRTLGQMFWGQILIILDSPAIIGLQLLLNAEVDIWRRDGQNMGI